MNIYDTALKRLASRSRTVKEMKEYLLDKGFDGEEIGQLVADFTEYGYLNDEEYCRQYFRYAFGKGKGTALVFRELEEKGVDTCIIEDVYEEEAFSLDEKALAMKEAEKVIRLAGEEPPYSEKLVARVARRLHSKGYGSDTVYRIVGELRK